jgi:hypothetical protein
LFSVLSKELIVKNVPGRVRKMDTGFGSGEIDMNQFSSHPNHENRPLYEGPPPQGLSEARRAGRFFEFLVTCPPHRKPCFGAGAFIVPDG